MIWAYIGGGALLAGLAGGWYARDVKADADDKIRTEAFAKEIARRANEADAAAASYEALKASTDARERVVVKEVTRVVEKPVYRNECLDDDGLRILAADIQDRPATRQPAATLPAASAPR